MNVTVKRVARCVLVFAVIALSGCGQPKPPDYGVVHFGTYEGHPLPGIDSSTLEDYKQEGKELALLHFRSGPGSFVNLGFTLKSPEGEDLMPRYFRQGPDPEWQVAFSPEEKILNPILINQVMGDLDLYFIYVIEGQPSTDWVLEYEDENTSARTYQIVKGALASD
jgi:hypothetical protein